MNPSHRGVWHISWGTNRPSLLLAIDSHDQLLTAPVTVPPSADPVAISSQLWDALDTTDPSPVIGRAPSFARMRRSTARGDLHLHLSRGGR